MSIFNSQIENLLSSQISIINQELLLFESMMIYNVSVSTEKIRLEKIKNYRSAIRKLHLIKKHAPYMELSEIYDLILGRKFEKINYGQLKARLSMITIKPAA